MKKFLTTTLLFTVLVNSYGQDTTGRSIDCLQSKICTYDLYCDKNDPTILPAMFSTVIVSPSISYAKSSNPSGYPGDIVYADENNGTCTNDLGSQTEICNNNTNALQYVVYYPKPYDAQTNTGYDYSKCLLPVYINVHGGGFSDCRDGSENTGDNVLCIAMAQRGFVVYDVGYRLGVKLARPSKAISAQQQLGVYRASQDIRGAIRSIIRVQQDQDNGIAGAPTTLYKINTNYIFLGGNSAGSITVLNVAYYPNQSMIGMINPHGGSYTIAAALGPIEADFYYGGTNIEYRSKLKGVLDQWGSVTLPSNYGLSNASNAKDFFGNVRIPVICFHGKMDQTVPIDIAPVSFATSADNNTTSNPPLIYNSESSCLKLGISSFQTDNSTLNNPDLYTYGSRAFYTYVLQPLGIPSEIYIDCTMHHGLDKTDGPTFQSDFGTCYDSADQVSRYIAARAAVFFQNIIGQNAQARQNSTSTNKIFIDCLNYHNQCDLGNADAGCTPNQTCPSPTDACTN